MMPNRIKKKYIGIVAIRLIIDETVDIPIDILTPKSHQLHVNFVLLGGVVLFKPF
jgi:hypothetical protein